MGSMFQQADAFNNGGSTSINNWDTSSVTDMTYMFLNADIFNQPVGNWNTSSVTSMNQMFRSAEAFNQDIGNWNVSNVTNMQLMFSTVSSVFNQDLSGWCVPTLTAAQNINNAGTDPVWGTCPSPQVTLTDTDADNYVIIALWLASQLPSPQPCLQLPRFLSAV